MLCFLTFFFQCQVMEVCVDNIQSAINAHAGGAARIELCSSLNDGGLTPSLGFFKTVKQLVTIPIYVMLRPRRGMDFVYSEAEIQSMKYDASEFVNAGAIGFTFGILNEDGTVNTKACEEILEIVRPRHCTFHRAFDCLPRPFDSLNEIIELGFERILTSGQRKSAEEGCKFIEKLVQKADNRIAIVPAAGVNERNVVQIMKETGATQAHGSFRTVVKRNFNLNTVVSMGTMDYNNDLLVTDRHAVEAAVNSVRNYLVMASQA